MLSSCAHDFEVWRDLESDDPSVSIIIGSISKAKYIARPGDEYVCPEPVEGQEVICVSEYREPPPIKLTIKPEEHLYGNELDSQFFANTTSHFGLNSFEIGNEQQYLMLILSDGVTNILPRYHFEEVNELYLGDLSDIQIGELGKAGLYALPFRVYESAVHWLPCKVQVLEKTIVKESKVGLYFFYNTAKEDASYDDELFYRKATTEELIKEHRTLILKEPSYHFKGGVLFKSTNALSVKKIKDRLKAYTKKEILEAYDQEAECLLNQNE